MDYKDNIQTLGGKTSKKSMISVHIRLYEENDFKAVIFHDHAIGLTGTKYSTEEEHDSINLDDQRNWQIFKNTKYQFQGAIEWGFVGQGN